MLRERPIAREVERDPRVGPGEGEVRRGVDRSRAPADDVDGLGGCQLVVCALRAASTSSSDWRSGRRQKPLVTPVAMTSTSYGSARVVPSGSRTLTTRSASESSVSVPWTVRTPSSLR